MSKNITIKEGGTAKQLTVDKLKTNLVSGGTCLWVPEDETQLGTKTITENGTYKASDDGYYGYSEVTVSGIGTATGTGEDGETHQYTEDGEGGITDTILPDAIVIEMPPSVTTYADGETIDYFGIVVKAYLKSGNLWTDEEHPDGIIPIEELIFPVTVADYDETTGQTASSSLIPGGFPFGTSAHDSAGPANSTADDYEYFSVSGGAVTLWKTSDVNVKNVCASADPSAVVNYDIYRANGQVLHETYTLRNSYTYSGQTVYHSSGSGSWSIGKKIKTMSPDATGLVESYSANAIAWTMIYGTITSGGQTIPVLYTRSDGTTLQDSFQITVNKTSPGYGEYD